MTTKLDMAKKTADIGDDAWNASRRFLPEHIVDAAGPYIIGSVMLFIHGLELRKAIRKFFKAMTDTSIGQRVTRMVTSGFGGLLSGVGVGLGITYIVGVSAPSLVPELIVASSPVLLPGLLLGIYSIYMGRKSYIFHQIKKAENQAKNEYIKWYRSHLKPDSLELAILWEAQHDAMFQLYNDAHEKRLKAEKKVAFSVIEVIGSSLVVSGVFLGSTVLLGLLGIGTIATAGALPTVLIVSGVVVGFASKVLEKFDEDGVYTKKIRATFRRFFRLGKSGDEVQDTEEQVITEDAKKRQFSKKCIQEPVKSNPPIQHINALLPVASSSFSPEAHQAEQPSVKPIFAKAPGTRVRASEPICLPKYT